MKTNHSLRATAASELFCANVPEKLIQERTGHKSLQALRIQLSLDKSNLWGPIKNFYLSEIPLIYKCWKCDMHHKS